MSVLKEMIVFDGKTNVLFIDHTARGENDQPMSKSSVGVSVVGMFKMFLFCFLFPLQRKNRNNIDTTMSYITCVIRATLHAC